MHPVYVHLAMDWLKAEQRANPADWEGRVFDRDAMSVAIDRVIAVVSGQVAWQDTSPGDKAVWKSRVEAVPMFERAWRSKEDPDTTVERTKLLDDILGTPEATPPYRGGPHDALTQLRPDAPRGPRLHGIRERLWWTFYDTLRDVGSEPQSYRLFGNRNIGDIFLTNLQVAGQLAGDQTFVVCSVYVTISSLEALHWAADNLLFQFTIGVRPMLPALYMRDMFRGVDLLSAGRRPLIIPVRQNFDVRVERRRDPPSDLPPFDITYHIEGLQTRDVA